MRRFLFVLALLALTLLSACGAPTPTAAPPATPTGAAATGGAGAPTGPGHIVVQHILIAFKGSVPDTTVTRTQDDAAKLAADVLAQAKAGANFDDLVKKYTADQAPGIYSLADTGVTPGQGEFSRDGMVKGFGDVAFSLQPGEIGMSEYDANKSPYGWHIIKRLQ